MAMNDSKREAASSTAMASARRAGDSVWEVRYHGCAGQKARFRAHCRHCAWQRFARQNDDCRVTAVVPADFGMNAGDLAPVIR